MGLGVRAKIAAFCRELGDESDGSLRNLAREHGPDMEAVFAQAEGDLRTGQVSPRLEADLDALDAMLRQAEGQSLYPGATRGYQPLPGPGGGTGAQWWTCPRNRCAGRGRVRVAQQPPACAATGEPLVAGPLPE